MKPLSQKTIAYYYCFVRVKTNWLRAWYHMLSIKDWPDNWR